MKVRIKNAECVGNARCEAVAPELYALDDEGFIETTDFEVVEDDRKAAIRGAKACPERIIFVIEDEDGDEKQIWPPVN